MRVDSATCSVVDELGSRTVATFVDCLCSASLQAAELDTRDLDLHPDVAEYPHEVVREMIRMYGHRFAVEVGAGENYQDKYRIPRPVHERPGLSLWRLAWRRWPAHNAPELPAARAAHERARAWVAMHEQLEAMQ